MSDQRNKEPVASGQRVRFSRRAGLGAALAGLVPVISGCGGDGDTPVPTNIPLPATGTPRAVAGYDNPARWQGRTLRVGAFGGDVQNALREQIWIPFAQATGCQIQEVTTDFAELEKSYDRNGEPYADVLLVDGFWVQTAFAAGAVEPIALGVDLAARLDPFGAIDGAVPAYAYAMVSAYRRAAAAQQSPPKTWADWWNGDTFAGGRSLPKGPLGSFEFALLADGVERDKLYPLDGARAIEKLKQISGKIGDLWWETGSQPTQWMSSERVDLVAAWHYRVTAAQYDGRDVDFNWDDGLLVADYWSIPKGTPSVDVATDFIAYALSPEVQAAFAYSIPLGPVNPDAFAYIDQKLKTQLPTSPEQIDVLLRVDAAWWATNKGEANERFNSWLLGVPMHES